MEGEAEYDVTDLVVVAGTAAVEDDTFDPFVEMPPTEVPSYSPTNAATIRVDRKTRSPSAPSPVSSDEDTNEEYPSCERAEMSLRNAYIALLDPRDFCSAK